MLTPLAAFQAAVQQQPNTVYLRQPINGEYQEYTWKQVEQKARNMAAQLATLGINKGDKVAIWSKNCAEWITSDLAIMMLGAISVPLYPGQSKTNVHYVLKHSEAKLLFVGKHDNDDDVIASIPENFPTISFPYYSGPSHYTWSSLVAKEAPADFAVNEPEMDDVMTIAYTSGTTGSPKGAVHTYSSFAFAANNIVDHIGITSSERSISFLPLAHVAERVLVEGTSFYSWATVSFVESLDTFAANMMSVKPTLFFAVPRLWAKFQEGILVKVGGQEKLDRLLSIPLLGNFIKKKIQKGLGLDKARISGCGASPMPKALLPWFNKLGILVVEGYGMTENLCYGTVSTAQENCAGAVGKAYRQNELKISEEGEILFKSPALMQGYYKEPEKTAEAFVDGFYRTGDKGRVDENGFLFITGRLKELFKTTKGKYIAPAPIEALLTAHIFIEQACVTGSGRDQPLAILELSDTARAADKADVQQQIEAHLAEVNRKVEHHERMDCLVLTQMMWTVESGLITPTLKVRRDILEDSFMSLADEGGPIVWAPLKNEALETA